LLRFAEARFTVHNANLVSPMLSASQQLRSQIQNLRRTPDLPLPRLLSGQVKSQRKNINYIP
jgi:hypothetical protein